VQIKWQREQNTFLIVMYRQSSFCALKPTKHLYFVSIIYAHCLLATSYGRLYYMLLTVAGCGTFCVEYNECVIIHKSIKGKAQT